MSTFEVSLVESCNLLNTEKYFFVGFFERPSNQLFKIYYISKENIYERFSKKLSEEVNQVFSSFRLRKVLYTDRPLSWIYKDVSLTKEKGNIIYKIRCHYGSDYVEKTSQRFHVRIDQHVPKNFEKLVWVVRRNLQKKYFSAIKQHLLNNHECAKNYRKKSFSVLVRADNSFQLHILEALCIQSFRPSLCKQKKFV